MRPSSVLILLPCLALLLVSSAVGHAQSVPAVSPFDRYGRINWEEEKKHLDGFAIELKKQPEMIGYIYIREAQISGEGYAVWHAIDLTKYLVKVHHIPWNRVTWRDLGFGDSFQTTYWLFPAGRPPLYVPAYQPATNYTFIEGRPMPGRRRKKRHSRHSAANKALQLTAR